MEDKNIDRYFRIRLKELRNKMRLLQRESAIKVEISLRALQEHEAGKMLSRTTL